MRVHLFLLAALLLSFGASTISFAQWTLAVPGSLASQTHTLFGPRGLCPNPVPWIPQTTLHLHTEADPIARWSFEDPVYAPICTPGMMPAGQISLVSTPGNLTTLSQRRDFVIVANDTANNLRLAANHPSANIHLDLYSSSPVATGMVDRMTAYSNGKFDFRIGNWNCNTGIVRFEAEPKLLPSASQPTIKLYRPTGMTFTCPNPESFAWWITVGANPAGFPYTGSLEFCSTTTPTAIGSESVNRLMTILRDGNVGINEREPLALLHVNNGAVLFANDVGVTTGSTPISGAGTRLMWIPERRAFRAGAVGVDLTDPSKATRWDDANIGNYSWAGGMDSEADAEGSIVHGQNCVSDGDWTAVFGMTNTAGTGGDYCLVAGQQNEVDAHSSVVLGTYCSVDGAYANTAIGQACTAGSILAYESHGNVALGHGCRAIDRDSFASGFSCHSEGHYAHTFGLDNLASEQEGYAFGSHIEIDTANAMLLGYGYNETNRFRPSASNVVELTVLSKSPTVTIRNLLSAGDGESEWPDSAGSVGINYTKPVNRLEVQGGVVIGSYANGYVGSLPRADVDHRYRLVVEGAIITGDDLTAYGGHQLYVNGTAYCTGGVWTPSDSSLKEDIQPYTSGLDEVLQINPITYRFKPGKVNDAGEIHVGVRAQELAAVLPVTVRQDTLVHSRIVSGGEAKLSEVPLSFDTTHTTTKTQYTPFETETVSEERLSIRQEDLVYTLINATKTLHYKSDTLQETIQNLADSLVQRLEVMEDSVSTLSSRVDSLELLFTSLQAQLDSVRNAVAENSISPSFQKSSRSSFDDRVFLEQNRPNPFSSQTEISMFVQEEISGTTKLQIHNMESGSLVGSFDVPKNTVHTITFSSSGLPSGVYVYSLSADGRVLASKKMLICK